MSLYRQLRRQPFNTRLAAVVVSLIAIGYLVVEGKEVLSPIVFSCLFSILLLPLAAWLENRCRLSRGMSAMISVLLMFSAIATVLYLVASQLGSLGSDWPLFKEQVSVSIDKLQHWIAGKFHIDRLSQRDYVDTAKNKLMTSGTVVVGATIISVSSMLLFLVFTFIYSFLFLVYRRLIMKFFIAVFLDENAAVVRDIIEQVQYIVRKYIVGLLLEMAIVTIVVAATFSIMGIRYAILLGVITGLFNLVPYIGIFTALAISSLITFATAAAPGQVLLVVITLVITHLVDSNILLPMIVGSKVRINALVTIIGVVIGEMLWGIPGMFLSVPVIAVLKIIFDRVDSLKPWGLLLGDDEQKKKRKKIKKVLETAKEAVEKIEGTDTPAQ
jgi:predicted PurR-regulated permease PerM